MTNFDSAAGLRASAVGARVIATSNGPAVANAARRCFIADYSLVHRGPALRRTSQRGRSLLLQPDILEPRHVVDAVHLHRQALQPRLPAGPDTAIKDHR